MALTPTFRAAVQTCLAGYTVFAVMLPKNADEEHRPGPCARQATERLTTAPPFGARGRSTARIWPQAPVFTLFFAPQPDSCPSSSCMTRARSLPMLARA